MLKSASLGHAAEWEERHSAERRGSRLEIASSFPTVKPNEGVGMCLEGTVEVVRDSEPTISRRAVLAGGGAAALAALMPGEALAHKRGRGHHRHHGRGKVADLTHEFKAGFPVYTGNAPARKTLTTIPANGFYKQEWTFDEHSGTHMDAPAHFTAGGRFTPQLPASELVLPLVVIDIARRAQSDPDTVVDADDLKSYERRYGRIPDGALVAMDSGWAKKIGNEAAYKGGPPGAYHFPGFGDDAIEVLLKRRKAAAIGVDTLSLDNGAVDDLLGARQLAQGRQLGAREPGQPRQGPAQRRHRHRRRHPLAGRLGRPGAGARDVLVQELADGLWRWTARHAEWHPGEWGAQVASFALDAGDVTLLIDPLVPDEDFLDSLVRGPVAILITIPYHTRSAEPLSERYGAKIYGHPAVGKRLRKATVEPIDGELPGGARAFPIGKPRRYETPIHLPSHKALAFGDALVTTPEGELRMWSRTRTATPGTASTFAPTFESIRRIDLERILVTHGEPILRDGSAALEAALSAPPWYHHG